MSSFKYPNAIGKQNSFVSKGIRMGRQIEQPSTRTSGKRFGVDSFQVGTASGADIGISNQASFYSPEISSDFLQLPRSREELFRWLRHFYEYDEIVGQSIDLHTELPLSKFRLAMPDCKNEEKGRKILRDFQKMCDRVKLFKNLLQITHEYFLIGEVYVYLEWDEDKKEWSKIEILNPEAVKITSRPFSSDVTLSLLPDETTLETIRGSYTDGDEEEAQAQVSGISDEIKEYLMENDEIDMETDPHTGTCVVPLFRKSTSIRSNGSSILLRCLRTLVVRDKLRQAQTMLADRNLSPKHIVKAPELNDVQLDQLREQFEYAQVDPDYAILTNFDFTYEIAGAQDRLLQLTSEYEEAEKRLMIGLGVTKELLTGEALYGGARLSLEILNSRYMLFREIISEFIHDNLFAPVARAKGYIEIDEDGQEKLIYPKIGFSRLAVRDSQDVFDAFFNLHSKGDLPLSFVLDLYNLDERDIENKLKEDLFTLKDPNMNALLTAAYDRIAEKVLENTDFFDRLSKGLGLRIKPEQPPEEDMSEEEGGSLTDRLGGPEPGAPDASEMPSESPMEESLEPPEVETPTEREVLEPSKKKPIILPPPPPPLMLRRKR